MWLEDQELRPKDRYLANLLSFAYANDIDVCERTLKAVREAYSKLEKEANRVGLAVNEGKTKFMIVAPSE